MVRVSPVANKGSHNLHIDPDINFFNSSNRLNVDVDQRETESQSLTIEMFNNVLLGDVEPNSNLLMVCLNIRSFYKHRDQLVAMLAELKYLPDILVLTETWLTIDDKDTASLEGYEVFHTIRTNTKSGGVSIYFRADLAFELLNNFSVCHHFVESCGVSLKLGSITFFIIGVYRPHSGTIGELTDWLGETVSTIRAVNSHRICLLGDFNIDLLNVNNEAISVFVDSLQSYNFIPVIREPTRFSPNLDIEQPTLLGHVWVNFFNFSGAGILDFDLTDHSPIYIVIDKPVSVLNDKRRVSFRDQSEPNLSAFCYDIEHIHWSLDSYDNLNDKFSYFINTVDHIYRKNCKMKIKFLSEKRISNPWINNELLSSIKAKSNYFRLYKRGYISKSQNNHHKNRLNSVIRRAKRRYYHDYFSNFKSDMRKYWEGVRSLIGRRRNRGERIESMNIGGSIVSDEQEIANGFNLYFSSIAYSLRDNLPPVDNVSVTEFVDNVSNSFYFFPVTGNECHDIISKLKNTSYGMNNISTRILKLISKNISL